MKPFESSRRGWWSRLGWLVIVLAPLALVGSVFAMLTRAQQGALRDWLLSVLVLCPLMLCVLPLYLLMLTTGVVALPKAATVRRKKLQVIRSHGLVLHGRLRNLRAHLPEHPVGDEGRKSIALEQGEERNGSKPIEN